MTELSPLQIVLTYDDPIAAAAARETLGNFVATLAHDIEIQREDWSFGELAHPQCWKEALELARSASVFVIAVTGQAVFPPSFLEWIEEWLATRDKVDTALVLCVGCAGDSISNSRIIGTIQSIARANGMAFFATPLVLPVSAADSLSTPRVLLERLNSLNLQAPPESSGLND